ncbi:MAG: hypothetical protein ACMXYL_01535 [Candidatus Woesearchaeota archaeon]
MSEINHQEWEPISGLGPKTISYDTTIVVVNKKPAEPITPTGSLEIVKYVCPENVPFARSANAPNSLGEHYAPVGCNLAEGIEFGYVYDPDNSGTGGPYLGLDDGIEYVSIGKTNSSGRISISGLYTEGRYGVSELVDGARASDDNVLAFFCYGDPGTFTDNWEMAFIEDKRTTHCVMYNKAETPICEPEKYKTYSMGGWGSPGKGNNPGKYRDDNFVDVFPNGLMIGKEDGYNAIFTSAKAIQDNLPNGGKPSSLTENTIDTINGGGVLAGQAIALTLNVRFDSYDESFGSTDGTLGQLIVKEGVCSGMSVFSVLKEANKILSGADSDYTASQISDCIDNINNNFVDGEDKGYLIIDCYEPSSYDDVTSVRPYAKIVKTKNGNNEYGFACNNNFGADQYTWFFGDGTTLPDANKVALHSYSMVGSTYVSCYALNTTTKISAHDILYFHIDNTRNEEKPAKENEPEKSDNTIETEDENKPNKGRWIWFGPEQVELAGIEEEELVEGNIQEYKIVPEEIVAEDEETMVMASSPLTGRAIQIESIPGILLLLIFLSLIAIAIMAVRRKKNN